MTRVPACCLLALALALALACAGTARGQSLAGALGPGQAALEPADAPAMIETALEGFRDRATERFDRLDLAAAGEAGEAGRGLADRPELDALLESRVAELESSIESALHPLRLDGVLDRREASNAIGNASDAAWLSLVDAVDARVEGHRIPPRSIEYEAPFDFAREMAAYVLLERNGPLDHGILLASIVIGIVVAWFVSRLLARLREALEDRDFAVAGRLASGSRGPLYVTLALGGIAVGLQRYWLPRSVESTLWKVLELAFIAATLWLAWTLASLLAQGLGWMLKRTYRTPDRQVVTLIRRSLHLVVLVVFAFVVAELVFGVELQSVLIGVGLIGIAVTLAAQDTLKNLFASLTIVIDRPFRVGDLVEFKDYFGTIEDIGFRSTKLRELDGHLVTIPNSEIVREPIQDVEARPWIRRRMRIGLRYDTPPAKVKKAISIIKEVLEGRGDEPERMKSHVVLEGFGESTLTLLMQYGVEPGEYWEALERGSELHLEILDRFNEAGIEFAFPTRRAVIESAGEADREAAAAGND